MKSITKLKASPPPVSSLLTSRFLQKLLNLCTSCCIKIIAISENYNGQFALTPLDMEHGCSYGNLNGLSHVEFDIKSTISPECHQTDAAAGG